MLDLKFITENTEALKANLELRGFKDIGLLDELARIIHRKKNFKRKRNLFAKRGIRQAKRSEKLSSPVET